MLLVFLQSDEAKVYEMLKHVQSQITDWKKTWIKFTRDLVLKPQEAEELSMLEGNIRWAGGKHVIGWML